MAYEVFTVLILFVSYLIFIIIRWAIRRHQKLQIFKKYGIPGPEPNFLTGNMTQLKAQPTPNDIISQWIKEYGNIYGYFIGDIPFVIVNDVSLIKQAMIKDFHNFVNRQDMFLDVKPLVYTILALRDQRWKEVRSVLTPTFSSNKIKLMTKIVNQKVTTTLNVIQEKAQKREIFDMYAITQALTLDVIADCALAMKVRCQEDNNDMFLLAVRDFFRTAHNKAVELAIIFPFIAKVMTFLSNYLTAGQMTTMIVKNIKEVIRQRRKNPEIRGTDILQLLLDASEVQTTDPPGQKHKVVLTDDEIIANAYVSLLAGYETTGTALAFTFYLLVKHPEIQEKLYVEIMSKCTEDEEELSYDTVQSLHYLDQVFNESLRIYPPVTGFVTRKSQNDYKLGDYTIPAGSIVQAPVWDIHHDPDLWPDPWKFDPDRFSNENKENIVNFSFLPFGIGPRNCIGMRFAQLEAKLALARLVKKFKFVPSEKTDDPLPLICPTVIINPANGVQIRAIIR